jgi:hypothetical protein
MDKSKRQKNDFDPEGSWSCTWQDKYGSGGNLECCFDMVSGYIESDNRSINEVQYQLLKEGHASGYWWSIWYEGDEFDEEADIDNSDSDQEQSCYFHEDVD